MSGSDPRRTGDRWWLPALLVAALDAGAQPAPTPEALAAAFPDLGGMEAREMSHDDPFETLVLFDELERQGADSRLVWDLKGWAGKDIDKLLVRSEGERESGATSEADIEGLWAHAIAPWWDFVAGVRHDLDPSPSRSWLAFGVQGISPYEFDVEATAYLGENGRAALRLKAEYELLITQRLVLQPLAELNWYSKDDTGRGIGSGVSSLELGLRLRYEIRREIAPYVGLVATRKRGGTADLARLAGDEATDSRLVAGVRIWF